MTREELERIEARANAATEGPWKHMGVWRRDGSGWGMGEGLIEDADGNIVVYDEGKPDGDTAEFIAHARTDVPALCDALREAWAEIERIRSLINEDALEKAVSVAESCRGEWLADSIEYQEASEVAACIRSVIR